MSSHCPDRIVSPSSFPPDLRRLFDQLTGSESESWGLLAAIALSRFKKRHSRAPSFAEFFDMVLATRGLQAHSDVEWAVLSAAMVYSFRHHVAVHWRRQGWISWSLEPHSLRHGKAFQAASKEWRSRRSAPQSPSSRLLL